MHIRRALPDDLPQIAALLQRSYPELMRPAYPPALLAAALPALTRPNPELVASGRFYLAEAMGVLQGCGGWSRAAPGQGPETPGFAQLRHFAVDPASIGTGVGRALFQRCTAEARSAGARHWQALSSLNAEAFYTRMGLTRIEALTLPLGPDCAFPVLRMEGAL